MSRLQVTKDQRLEKLNKLQDIGIDPFPSNLKSQPISTESAKKKEGQSVAVSGRIFSWRSHGNLIFASIKDESGRMQIMLSKKDLESQLELIKIIDIGDFILVSGEVFTTKTGEITIKVVDLQLLTKSILPLPSTWYGLKDKEERFRKRYLDLIMNDEVKERIKARSQIVRAIRNFLDEKGFLEIETPTLQPIYGGGFARPFVTHHNTLNSDFYLRISDEMYLKRLIVGGFEKVYEITKVFRNEGVDYDHNPEFTMFEAQIAYKDYFYGMDLIEEIFEYAAKEVLGTTQVKYKDKTLKFSRPWQRLTVVESIKKHTKIDVLSWKNLDQAKKACRALVSSKSKLSELEKMNTIGEVIAFTFEETVEEKLIQPTIIYDYPIEISPLAKKCKDPRFTQRFEMFAMGSELGNNYTELNDPVDLRKRFVEEKKREKAGFDEAHQTDHDYLTAIEHGFPPTCGIAIGIDRMVMMMTNASSIKEVIAFPTLKPKK
jgi:lysyl-tRNA synthetase, class II